MHRDNCNIYRLPHETALEYSSLEIPHGCETATRLLIHRIALVKLIEILLQFHRIGNTIMLAITDCTDNNGKEYNKVDMVD